MFCQGENRFIWAPRISPERGSMNQRLGDAARPKRTTDADPLGAAVSPQSSSNESSGADPLRSARSIALQFAAGSCTEIA